MSIAAERLAAEEHIDHPTALVKSSAPEASFNLPQYPSRKPIYKLYCQTLVRTRYVMETKNSPWTSWRARKLFTGVWGDKVDIYMLCYAYTYVSNLLQEVPVCRSSMHEQSERVNGMNNILHEEEKN